MSVSLKPDNMHGAVEDKNGNWVRVFIKVNPIKFNQVALQTLM